jgi:quercetin dioxygenase-like cupin family protein
MGSDEIGHAWGGRDRQKSLAQRVFAALLAGTAPLGVGVDVVPTKRRTAMRNMKMIQVAIVSALIALAGPASAQSIDHTMLGPHDVKWAKAPPSVPPGAEASVLYGDPGKEGLFVLRLKLPKGYAIPLHTHPKPEIVTIISGTFILGMGNVADKSNAKPLPAGSFFAFEPGMAHYAFTDEETVFRSTALGRGVSIT